MHILRKISILLLLLSNSLFAQQEQSLNIVVTIKPLYGLVAEIMQGVAQPQLLLAANASPHSFSLKPSDRKKLAAADHLFWIGPELESFIRSSDEPLLNNKQLKTHDYQHDGHKHTDPHIWLDLDNAIILSQIISNKLSDIDPEHKTIYRNNSQQQIAKLKALKQQFQLQLAELENHSFAVFHNAYGYFTQSFNLQKVYVITQEPELPLSPKELKQLYQLLEAKQLSCLFTEPQFNQPLLQQLAKKYQIKLIPLDPLGTLLDNNSYEKIMQNLVEAFSACQSYGATSYNWQASQ